MMISHILHPTDFSDYSKGALDYARSLAKLYNAKLTLMYVVDEINRTHSLHVPHIPVSASLAELEASAKKELERCSYEELRGFKDVEKVVPKGIPDEEILKYADEKGVDLIVMGTPCRSGMDFVFGSTAEKVIRKAKCSVLCVKAPSERAS